MYMNLANFEVEIYEKRKPYFLLPNSILTIFTTILFKFKIIRFESHSDFRLLSLHVLLVGFDATYKQGREGILGYLLH